MKLVLRKNDRIMYDREITLKQAVVLNRWAPLVACLRGKAVLAQQDNSTFWLEPESEGPIKATWLGFWRGPGAVPISILENLL